MSKKNIPNYIRKQRGDWGAINPVTKVIPNKKRNYIPDEYNEYYSIDDCNREQLSARKSSPVKPSRPSVRT